LGFEVKVSGMNEKVLLIAIFSLLAIGAAGTLYLAVSWLSYNGSMGWQAILLDNFLILISGGVIAMGIFLMVNHFR
jgi:hypothetical protein